MWVTKTKYKKMGNVNKILSEEKQKTKNESIKVDMIFIDMKVFFLLPTQNITHTVYNENRTSNNASRDFFRDGALVKK